MRPFCVYYLYIIVDYILFKSDRYTTREEDDSD